MRQSIAHWPLFTVASHYFGIDGQGDQDDGLAGSVASISHSAGFDFAKTDHFIACSNFRASPSKA
jgi:hypothetical protein